MLDRTNRLTELAAQIIEEHKAAQLALAESVLHAVVAGGLLMKAKAELAHGRWLPWLHDNVHIAERTAQIYMQLARLTPQKRNAVADLPLREAMAAIAHKRKLENPSRIVERRPSPVEHSPPRPPLPPPTPEDIADELMEQLANALHEARDAGLTIKILAEAFGRWFHVGVAVPYQT
jgi:hypothetical protein